MMYFIKIRELKELYIWHEETLLEKRGAERLICVLFIVSSKFHTFGISAEFRHTEYTQNSP